MTRQLSAELLEAEQGKIMPSFLQTVDGLGRQRQKTGHLLLRDLQLTALSGDIAGRPQKKGAAQAKDACERLTGVLGRHIAKKGIRPARATG